MRRQTMSLPASAFIRNNPAILGTSRSTCSPCYSAASGAVADLARDILQAGPLASASCAPRPRRRAVMTIVLARYVISRQFGLRMFRRDRVRRGDGDIRPLAVDVAIVLALALLGAADTISVVIRFSLCSFRRPTRCAPGRRRELSLHQRQ